MIAGVIQAARFHLRVAVLVGSGLLCTGALASEPGGQATNRSGWVGAWASSQQLVDGDAALAPAVADDVNLRQIVRISIGGSQLRVRVANTFGTSPLQVEALHVARSLGAGAAGIVPGSDTAMTFSGRPSVTVPAGAVYLSDPVPYPIEAFTDLAVTLRLNGLVGPQTGHPGSRATSFRLHGVDPGSVDPADAEPITGWHQLAGVDVLAPGAAAVVVLGDSITDGHGSTTDGNDRWTDFLARRLQAHPDTHHLSVLNHGIGGNRLLQDGNGSNALARFERDVLAQPNVRYLIVLEGVNDLGMAMRAGRDGAEQRRALVRNVIAAYQQIIARARTHRIQVFGATILPHCGSDYYVCTPASEEARQAVNRWIRTAGWFDGYIDFDALLRDPDEPDRLLPAYDSGDHLHPSPAGFQAMAQAVPLSLFTTSAAGSRRTAADQSR